MGEKVAQVYQGPVERGVVRTFTYTPNSTSRKSLVYRFTVNGQVVTGKVLYMN
jgi:ribosomal protein S12